MRRRDCLKALGGTLALGVGACSGPADTASNPQSNQHFSWKMVTTWPPNFPGFGSAALRLAKTIETNSGGRLQIKVYAGGELIPPLEVFDAVSRGTAEMGHASPAYWRGKAPAARFFNSLPFGMTARATKAWLYHGGGLALWREAYAPFDLIPFACGNTGVQMGGWFNKEVHTLDDFRGLKMRIASFGGEVLHEIGATPVLLPGSEVLTAMQTGAIDATEWTGPFADIAWGLHQVARYYYYPGWHEPSGVAECLIGKVAYESLPEDLQGIVTTACQAEDQVLTSEFYARNVRALSSLVEKHDVQLRQFSPQIIGGLKSASHKVISEIASGNDFVARVYRSYREFQEQAQAWDMVSEYAYADVVRASVPAS